MEKVILVTDQDEVCGEMEKFQAHERGELHRAFSILLFNQAGEYLLQKRASGKYHSANLWTNSCCGHPRPGESTVDGASRRLQEELGIQADLNFQFSFRYETKLGNHLVENEIDHVYFGSCEQLPSPNLDEASECRFISKDQLNRELLEQPESFTVWFKIIHERIK